MLSIHLQIWLSQIWSFDYGVTAVLILKVQYSKGCTLVTTYLSFLLRPQHLRWWVDTLTTKVGLGIGAKMPLEAIDGAIFSQALIHFNRRCGCDKWRWMAEQLHPQKPTGPARRDSFNRKCILRPLISGDMLAFRRVASNLKLTLHFGFIQSVQ